MGWVSEEGHYGKEFKMAADTTQSCLGGHGSPFFDLAGEDVKWKTVSLTHVEYPEGTSIAIWDRFI